MRLRAVLPLMALLAGCIPQVAPPPRGPAPASYREPPPPADDDRPPRDDDDAAAVRRANQDALDATPEASESAPRPVALPPSSAQDTPPSPPARPAWEARPVAADAEEVPASHIAARAGDTLARLAARTGTGAGAIAQANGLAPNTRLTAGQELAIPGGRYHTVRAGQSGIAIARAYGVPWSRIVAANALTEPFTLRAGERVLIPGTEPQTSAAAERAAAFTLDVDDILTGGEPALAVNQAPSRPVASPARVLPPTAQIAAPARLRGGFGWPVDGPVIARFGPGRSGERNDGIGIAVPLRTPVRAAADGVVVYAGTGIAALGGIVIVRHGEGWTTVYGHAAKLLVSRGQSVKRGQTIALSGQTGDAEQPDVHFELRKGRTPVDPASQLPPLTG